jgi:hypothetical protein
MCIFLPVNKRKIASFLEKGVLVGYRELTFRGGGGMFTLYKAVSYKHPSA